MTTEQRNSWIVDNLDYITAYIKRYCDRFPELDFEELYSEEIERVINKLDNIEEAPKRTDIGTFIGLHIHRKIDSVIMEEPHYCFERVYDFDPFLSIYRWEIEKLCGKYLSERMTDIFIKYLVDDLTFEEISKELGITPKRVRKEFLEAQRKLIFHYSRG